LCTNVKTLAGQLRCCSSLLTSECEVVSKEHRSDSRCDGRYSCNYLRPKTGAVLHHLHAFGRNKPVSHVYSFIVEKSRLLYVFSGRQPVLQPASQSLCAQSAGNGCKSGHHVL